MERFRKRSRVDALERLDALLPDKSPATVDALSALSAPAEEVPDPVLRQAIDSANQLIARSRQIEPDANPEDAAEMNRLTEDLRMAVAAHSLKDIRRVVAELEDLVFYLADH